MNFSKSILTVAMLVSVSAASALPGIETAKSVCTKIRTSVVNFADEAQFKVASNAKAVWAKVPSCTDARELFAAKSYDVKQVVAPYMTKKVAAVATAAGVVTAGSVVAYKKGYFGKAANFVGKNFVAAKNAVVAKFASKK
jgi:hypothetical protein